jgi:hypothetical protein
VAPVSVVPAKPLNMPSIPEALPIHVLPHVANVQPIEPPQLKRVAPVSVVLAKPLNMPSIPEALPIPRAAYSPYSQRASAPQRDIEALRPSPLVPPGVGVVARAVFDVHVIAADPVGEPSPPHSPGSDDFVYVSAESDMGLRNFPPVWGTADPGTHEDYFQGPKKAVKAPLAEQIAKRTEQLKTEGLVFLESCHHSEFVVNFLDQNFSRAVGQPSPGNNTRYIDSDSLKGAVGCKTGSKAVGEYTAGWCSYKKGDWGSEQIAENLVFTIAKEKIRAPLIGIFDPIGGSKAAEFLRVNFARALVHHLQSLPYNERGLTPGGIAAGISLTFLQLNTLFFKEFHQYANQGSSATVVFILQDELWIANIGSSRAALHEQRKAFQYTPETNNAAFGLINAGKDARPEIIVRDLSTIHMGSHLIIGNDALFGEAGTVGLAEWVYADQGQTPEVIAYTAVHSVYEAIKKRGQNSSISCMLVPLDNRLWEAID